jgi:hypothetical protein
VLHVPPLTWAEKPFAFLKTSSGPVILLCWFGGTAGLFIVLRLLHKSALNSKSFLIGDIALPLCLLFVMLNTTSGGFLEAMRRDSAVVQYKPPTQALTDRGGDVIKNAVRLNAVTTNGAARIFRVAYASNVDAGGNKLAGGWMLITIMRTSGDHKEMGIAEPDKDNSFYVKDRTTNKTWPLMALRKFDDAEAGAGADLIFATNEPVNFDLIEGKDTSATAWHFLDVKVPGEPTRTDVKVED